jgi:hypothetical protein
LLRDGRSGDRLVIVGPGTVTVLVEFPEDPMPAPMPIRAPAATTAPVSAARTDWESMTAAVGSALRPAAILTWARSPSCNRIKVPPSRQAAK